MNSNKFIGFEEFSNNLLNIRHGYTSRFSAKTEIQKFINELLQLLFPHYSEQVYYDSKEIESKLLLLKRNLHFIMKSMNGRINYSEDKLDKFFEKIPEINKKLWKDAEFIFKGDPASEDIDEVILSYPGFFAIAVYRLAHEIYKVDISKMPRIMTEYAHQLTGIDIHPGAEIGTPFFIDHGTGIVIGETAKIGNRVKIYQGVTLGALSVDKKMKNVKRHPTIEDDVVIYAQAVILGGETVIGQSSVIGGNVWLTQSVPAYSVVYHQK
ncbi:MAG: serine O-acetyltransferase EpsC [Melioribacteraceae bacterium]|nr:serine O-acetyltransferase EpsC [Melioribacteraceae bacterium]